MTKTKSKAATWEQVFERFPGSLEDLASAMGISRMHLWNLRRCRHAKQPWRLIDALHKALTESGTNDGSEVPTLNQLHALWRAAQSKEQPQ